MKTLLKLIFAAILGLSCINQYRTKLDGKITYTDVGPGYLPLVNVKSNSELIDESTLLLSQYEKTGELEYYSDYAAALVYLGKYNSAKNIYFQIENQTPNLYTTASNLGTIYELIGTPDSALFWIKKSVELNPDSHEGSEWIHIKILEFQILNSVDYSHSILGLNFGSNIIPENVNQIDLEKTKYQIYHQLEERLQFVQPENQIVGNIYFDLGNILALTDNVEAAIECYKEAIRFGFESGLMDLRIKEFEIISTGTDKKIKTREDGLNSKTKATQPSRLINIILFAGVVILISIIALIILRRVKKNNG